MTPLSILRCFCRSVYLLDFPFIDNAEFMCTCAQWAAAYPVNSTEDDAWTG